MELFAKQGATVHILDVSETDAATVAAAVGAHSVHTRALHRLTRPTRPPSVVNSTWRRSTAPRRHGRAVVRVPCSAPHNGFSRPLPQVNVTSGRVAALAYKCDISNGANVAEVFAAIDAVITPATLSVLVNNAGVAAVGALDKTTEADLDRQ